ncbi:microviridin/marinostatin family tricyclic proteinase inhibitor [Gloeothece verrucosa]|uniref:Microviridin/marinostatin family tricyclic proteinase inhibitor n=1 Tax=Gloeothece verrucosa (strain PCC 7822) TaxID=497965 RepID=E0UGC5_GLOV7|nr:microviridin/marinostatin family tricyclic proteinase inhibitor [Gloeothece verrucosa]ADN16744.1 hypothetical protein Cyan7822_4853 [Gloeothece verrucosa PCC 7822]
MSKNTGKAREIRAVVPFFARFLEEQAAHPANPLPFTLKYPSDWEDE